MAADTEHTNFMPNPSNKNPHNVTGEWYCDLSCEGCGKCVFVSPDNFTTADGKSWVKKQPTDKDETLRMMEAKSNCPVQTIGDNGVLPPLPPPAPANLVAVAGVGCVVMSWDKVDGAIAYFIKRSTVSGEEVTIDNTNALTYTDQAETGTTHFYVVSAVGAGGESPNSNEVEATPI